MCRKPAINDQNPVAYIRMRHVSTEESTLGRIIEFDLVSVSPLTCRDLWQINDINIKLNIQCVGTNITVNSRPESGQINCKFEIELKHVRPYALVKGGWLPMPFAAPPQFLVDRNVISALESIYNGRINSSNQGVSYWTQLVQSPRTCFNPSLYALESNQSRPPTFCKYVDQWNKGYSVIRRSFPKIRHLNYSPDDFIASYTIVDRLKPRGRRESHFLQKAAPLLADRVARGKEDSLLEKIIKFANESGIKAYSPVVLAVLSILYENPDGNPTSPGRLLIKPKKTYSKSDAYNAISDLRHIEMAAISLSMPNLEHRFALCTNDKGLALFWSSLNFDATLTNGQPINLNYQPSRDLFPRLNEQKISELIQRLKSHMQ